MKKILKDWFVPVPWGKIALISWGNPVGEPVLLVHGREDSAATFIPLLELLPDTYHYVGLDLPGCGKSDPFPIGVMLTRLHYVSAVDLALKHLGWKQFIFVGHSFGGEIALFYSALRQGKIKKVVYIDIYRVLLSVSSVDIPLYFEYFSSYYELYTKYNYDERLYTKRRALDAVKKARGMTEEQALLILSRSLNQVGEDTYKLSHDRRSKTPASLNLPIDFLMQLFTLNAPPTLFISASPSTKSKTYTEGREAAMQIISHLERNTKEFHMRIVEGPHDLHFTHPEQIAKDICWFLETDFGVQSKL